MTGRRRATGFTLIELMVVIVILGALAAVVLPNVLGHEHRAIRKTVAMQLGSFRDAIVAYQVHRHALPPTLDALTEPDPESGEAWLEPIPKDPWGGDYELRPDGKRHFAIASAGEDRRMGTDDDVVLHSRDGLR